MCIRDSFAEIPLDSLLSEGYGKERFALIDPERATPEFGPGEPILEGEGDTTYLTVADADGMMVSLIQSNYRGMGTGLVPDGLGFMLQNRGELFSLDEGHPNVYAPGKRPFHTIIPAFVMKDGEPFFLSNNNGGVLGGISSGQDIIARFVVKPTSSIISERRTIDLNFKETSISTKGRHDPCVGIRAVPVGEAMLATTIADHCLRYF